MYCSQRCWNLRRGISKVFSIRAVAICNRRWYSLKCTAIYCYIKQLTGDIKYICLNTYITLQKPELNQAWTTDFHGNRSLLSPMSTMIRYGHLKERALHITDSAMANEANEIAKSNRNPWNAISIGSLVSQKINKQVQQKTRQMFYTINITGKIMAMSPFCV